MKNLSSRNSVGPSAQRLTAPGDTVGCGVERQIADHQHLAGQCRADAAHDRADPGNQLARGERLGDIVVRAGFQPAHAVVLCFARGEQDDGNVCGFLGAAQAAADLDAAGALDHPVEHDQIGHLFAGQQQRLVAIGGGDDIVAFGLEAEFEQFGECRIILDEEQAGGSHPTGAGSSRSAR